MKLLPFSDGFSISLNEKEMLKHTKSHPMISLGHGEADIISSSGNFKVGEHNTKMIPLTQTSIIEQSNKKIIISFNEGVCVLEITTKLDRLIIKPRVSDSSYNRFEIAVCADNDERIYGSGELFDRQNLRDEVRPLWISEPGVGRRKDLFTMLVASKTKHIPRWFHSNFAIPSWVSSHGRYFYSDFSGYGELNFKEKDFHKFYTYGIPQTINIGHALSMKEALTSLTLLLGRQQKLPTWVYDGIILGIQGGKDIVEKKLAKSEQHEMKVAGVWCQDWQGIRNTSFGKQLRWNWQYDEKLYPELPSFTKELNKKGIKYLGYINTFLTPGTPLYKEAEEKGYFVTNTDHAPYPVYVPFDPGMLIDFTNIEAREWLKCVIKKNMIDVGLSGWMADFGEYIPSNSILASKESPLTYHNSYPNDWAKINREAIEEMGKSDEIMFFMRAGGLSFHKDLSAFWSGDQLVDFSKEDGLPSAINASLVLGMSAVAYVHSDIGGYTTLLWKKRTTELLLRWAEYSAFTQTMRTHEGNRPQNNIHFDDESTIAGVARMSRIFSTLKPYHEALSEEYQNTGIPPMRMVQLHYPLEIEELEKWPYQYLYGEDLLVAPVIKKNKKTWKVYLPGDQWVHLWTKETYTGKNIVTVNAPIGEPPVFYRAKSKYKELFNTLV
jgi:alpha-glucosidase